jgi:hypothetical protein
LSNALSMLNNMLPIFGRANDFKTIFVLALELYFLTFQLPYSV